MNLYLNLARELGLLVPFDAHILDLGCGSGKTVYSFVDEGYKNTVGFDIKDYLVLRQPSDRCRFFIAKPGETALPFPDNSFDFVFSQQVLEHVMDQVGLMRELHRVMKAGAGSIHVFPARYSLIERHIYVPLGGVIVQRWWYKLWALLGVRNGFQKGLPAGEVADLNAFYYVENLNYVPNSCYQVIWHKLGFQWKWLDQEHFDASHRTILRLAGRLNRARPLIGWLNRTLHTRRVFLRAVKEPVCCDSQGRTDGRIQAGTPASVSSCACELP